MYAQVEKPKENKSIVVANAVSQRQNSSDSTFRFVDNRPEAFQTRKLRELTNNSSQAIQLKALQDMANNSLQAKQMAQMLAMADNYSSKKQPLIQKKENHTGLPGNLKSGIENLSGYSMDDLKVHYNSDKPAQLQAHAYAQGTDIHLGSGQEKHLPHEAWHVVQQKQGRVSPTMQLKHDVSVNSDTGLEKEADEMDRRALQQEDNQSQLTTSKQPSNISGIVQRRIHITTSNQTLDSLTKEKRKNLSEEPFQLSVATLDMLDNMAKYSGTFTFDTWQEAATKADLLKGIPGFTSDDFHFSGHLGERKTINQPGYATGDMFGIAAAMIINQKLDVVISKGPTKGKDGYDPTDKADSIKAFYKSCGISRDRIMIADVANIREQANKGMKDKSKRRHLDTFGATQINNQIKGVTHGTDFVAKNWNTESQDKVRTALDVGKKDEPNKSKDEAIADWLRDKNIPTHGNSIAILWSRFSGKKGDIHLEHDTSYQGIRQLVLELAPKYQTVIIAGDPSATPNGAKKYDEIATAYGVNVFNLTGFWETDKENPKLIAWGGNTRLGQLKLYDYLDRYFVPANKKAAQKHEGLKHLGARSGNLELMAMLGHTVRYMEEPDSQGGTRMKAWHHHADGKTRSGGDATGYERIMISRPPTRSGKYLVDKLKKDRDNRRPEWAPAKRTETNVKPEKIKNETKGFQPESMAKIRDYLGVPEPQKKANDTETLDKHTEDLSGDKILSNLLKKVMLGVEYPNLKKLILPETAKAKEAQFIKHIENMNITVEYKIA